MSRTDFFEGKYIKTIIKKKKDYNMWEKKPLPFMFHLRTKLHLVP